MRASMSALVCLGLSLSAPAWACGGFFCNSFAPVDQSAERIVFGVDSATSVVTMHAQITYQGESDAFAWVVPVQGEPDLFLSSDTLFAQLDSWTQPSFSLIWDYDDDCEVYLYEADGDTADTADTDSGGGDVIVVSQQTVGPYDTVVLQATSDTALLEWLQTAGYDLPDTLGPALAPYVAANQYFVALKLTKGNEVGDLQPLGLRYPGSVASIPIQLTSIAATPDMRLEVYLLGDHRAVPDNYLHVVINEAAIDWFTGGSNYEDVITRAADEAGGHAFATDFAGDAGQFVGRLWSPGRYDLTGYDTQTDPVAWVNGVLGMGVPATTELLDFLEEFVPMPQAAIDAGITSAQFYGCMDCYPAYTDSITFDPAAATAALKTRIIDPLEEGDRLFRDHDHLTRLTSSLDAVEMTIDPLFTFNGDITQSKSQRYEATVEVDCPSDGSISEATRIVVLSDGRRIALPSEDWMLDNGVTYLDYISDLTSPAAIVIEDMDSSGEPEVIADYRDEAAEAARIFSKLGSGCGCDTAPAGLAALGGLPLLLLLGLRRRDG